MNYLIRILNIKTANIEDQENLDFQMPIILDFIKTKFGSLTIPEIQEAFKMYVAKEFDLKVFRMFDCVAVGEILTAFLNYRNESLRIYDDKKRKLLAAPEPTTEATKNQIRIEFLKSIFEELQQQNFSKEIWLLWETDLTNKELTPFAIRVNETMTNSEKRKLYSQEENIYLKNLKIEAKITKKHNLKWDLENAIRQIKNHEKINSVVNRCRCLVGSKYLQNYLADFEIFNNEINN